VKVIIIHKMQHRKMSSPNNLLLHDATVCFKRPSPPPK